MGVCTMRIVDLEQRSEAWHDWRLGHLCATDAVAYLNASPYKTKSAMMLEKAEVSVSEDISNLPHIRQGIAAEADMFDQIEHYFPEETVIKPGVCVESTDHPWLAASLDAYVDPGDGSSITPIEFKSVGEQRFEEFLNLGKFPEHFKIQLQHQCLVTGSKVAYLVMSNKLYKQLAVRIVGFSSAEISNYLKELSSYQTELEKIKESNKKSPLIPELPKASWDVFDKSCREIVEKKEQILRLKIRINNLQDTITDHVFGGSLKKSGKSKVFSRVPKGRVLIDQDSQAVICDFFVKAI